MAPFLVAPKERMSTPASRVKRPQRESEGGGRVGDPGAVHVHPEPQLVRGGGEGDELLAGVDRAVLGHLGERDHRRLHVMKVADAGHRRPEHRRRELAVGRGDVDELAPARSSGAPHSSTWMCACAVQTTACQGRVSARSETTLAPVPFQTGKTAVSGTELLPEPGR